MHLSDIMVCGILRDKRKCHKDLKDSLVIQHSDKLLFESEGEVTKVSE